MDSNDAREGNCANGPIKTCPSWKARTEAKTVQERAKRRGHSHLPPRSRGCNPNRETGTSGSTQGTENLALRSLSIAKPNRAKSGQKSKVKSRGRRSVRRRRTPDEARSEALVSARDLLLREGPDALTLQRVSAEVGMSHTNLLHHFGSIWELQSALMAMMVSELTVALDDAVTHFRSDQGAPRALIDMVFDAFDQGGAGRLAAWIALSGKLDHLDPIEKAVQNLVNAVEEKFAYVKGDRHLGVTSAVLFLGLIAFGDAVIGGPLKDMLDRERAAPRKIAAILLPKFFEVR